MFHKFLLFIFFISINSFSYAELLNNNTNEFTTKNNVISVSMVLHNGQFLELTDNSIWQINPQDVPTAKGWILPSEIVVSENANKNYPYTLTNSLTNDSIKAKKSSKDQMELIFQAKQTQSQEIQIDEKEKQTKKLKTRKKPKY